MFNTNLSEHSKIWGAQKRFGGNCPNVSAGLGRTVTRKSSIGASCLCKGTRNSEILFL